MPHRPVHSRRYSGERKPALYCSGSRNLSAPLTVPSHVSSQPRVGADLIVVYDVSEQQTLPTQLPARSQRLYPYTATHTESGHNNSYKKALDAQPTRAGERNGRALTISRQPLGQGVGGGSGNSDMTRSASLSHLLVGSRVETAFVGDDAYTVYYGNKSKHNRRY